MPTISRFLGISISMRISEHNPPHFHAKYGGARAAYKIEDAELLVGRMPPQQEAYIREWARLHVLELQRNWERTQRGLLPDPIPPLE